MAGVTADDMTKYDLVLLGERTLLGRVEPVPGDLLRAGPHVVLQDVLEVTIQPIIQNVGGRPMQALARGMRTLCLFDELTSVRLPHDVPRISCAELTEEHRKELADTINAIDREKRAQKSGLVLAGRQS